MRVHEDIRAGVPPGFAAFALGSGGLEQDLPAGEQLLQLVAGGAVLGQRVHVRPVLGELRLELGDVLLERRDPALDLLELGRALLRRLRGAGAVSSSRVRAYSAQPPA